MEKGDTRKYAQVEIYNLQEIPVKAVKRDDT